MTVHPITEQTVHLAHADRRTITAISDAAGVDRDALCRWMRGKFHPRLFMLQAVLAAVGYEIVLEKVCD